MTHAQRFRLAIADAHRLADRAYGAAVHATDKLRAAVKAAEAIEGPLSTAVQAAMNLLKDEAFKASGEAWQRRQELAHLAELVGADDVIPARRVRREKATER